MNSYSIPKTGDAAGTPNLESIDEYIEVDDEEKVIRKAEKRLDELCNIFTFIPSLNIIISSIIPGRKEGKHLVLLREEYKQLRSLLEQRAYLKLMFFYENSLKHLRELVEETERYLTNQRMSVADFQAGHVSMLKPQDTYIDESASVAATLKMYTSSWKHWKEVLLTNRWYYCKLDEYLAEYVTNLHHFYQSCIQICRLLNCLIDNAIFILCRLTEEAWLSNSFQEPARDFFVTFDELNGVYNHLRELRKSFVSYGPAKVQFKNWTVPEIFQKLASEDGVYLAQRLALEFVTQLITTDDMKKESIGKVQSTNVTVKEWLLFGDYRLLEERRKKTEVVKHQVNSLKVQKDPFDTSDYYTSSSSCSRNITDPEQAQLPEVENPKSVTAKSHEYHKTTLSKKTKRQLQNFYANFLERRYTTFNYLLEEGANHKSLHPHLESAQPGVKSNKSVTWLDDTLRKNRKHMWTEYVKTLWDRFLNEWECIVTSGNWKYGAVRLVNLEQGKRLTSIVLEALGMMQLPKELSPCDRFIHYVKACVGDIMMYCECRHLLSSSFKSKSLEPVLINDQSLELIRQIGKGRKCANMLETVQRMLLWKTCNELIVSLSSFNLINGYSITNTYLPFLEDENLSKHINQFADTFVKSKIQYRTRETLTVAFPTKKYWKATGRGRLSDNEYVQALQESVGDQVLKIAQSLECNKRMQFLITSAELIMRSWLNWLKEREYRFSRSGAIKLRSDFIDMHNYFRSIEWLSEEEKEALSGVAAFRQAQYIADVLEGKFQITTAQQGTVRYFKRSWRRIQVAPGNEENQMNSLDRDLLLVWNKYRARNVLPNCSCF